MLYISLSTGRSATRFWRKCIYANDAYVDKLACDRSAVRLVAQAPMFFSWRSTTQQHVSRLHEAQFHRRRTARGVPYTSCSRARLHRSRNVCSRGLRGLNFFMHSHPLMGGRPPKFQKKIRRFFVLLVTLSIRPMTPVLRVLGVWNLLCVLNDLRRDRSPLFSFQIRRKLFIFSTCSKI